MDSNSYLEDARKLAEDARTWNALPREQRIKRFAEFHNIEIISDPSHELRERLLQDKSENPEDYLKCCQFGDMLD